LIADTRGRAVAASVGAALGALVLGAAFVAVCPSDAQEVPDLTLQIEQNRFQPEEIRVKAGQPFVLVITNKDKGPEEFEVKDLRIEKIIPAGRTLRLRMPALKAGSYSFVGDYHEKTAKGRIIAE
jgi:plastocyanin